MSLIGNDASQELYDGGATMTGTVAIILNGRCVKEVNNLVVDSGKNLICERLNDNSTAVPSHIAIGDGSSAPVVGDTALDNELAREAIATRSVATNTIEYTANFAAGVGTGSIIEAGLLNAAVGGTMVCRTLFSGVVTKGAGDSLGLTWTLTVN